MLNNKKFLFITYNNLSNPRTGIEHIGNKNDTLLKELIKIDLLLKKVGLYEKK